MTERDRNEIQRLIQPIKRKYTDSELSEYADDPIGFGRDILGEIFTDDIAEVMLSVRDNPITIAESANAVGKTHGAARIAVWAYKCMQHLSPQIYTAAAPPISNLSHLLWGEIGSIVAKHPHLFPDDNTKTLHISQPKAIKPSFITGVSIPASGTAEEREARFSGKHAPYLLFILDEADAIPAEVYKGIESCLSGGKGRLLCMYNPRSDEGPIKAMKERGVPVVKISAFDHPNVKLGSDLIPGAVTRNKTITRIHKWTAPADMEGVDGLGSFMVPDFLVGVSTIDEDTGLPLPPLKKERRIIVEPEFSYMVIGEYPGVTVGVIYPVWSPQESVVDAADYEAGAGPVFWAIDDGYVGKVDPRTGMYTADSHPRVIGMYQYKGTGQLCRFDELYRIREAKPDRQIKDVVAMGYPEPEFVVVGPGSATLGGLLSNELGYYKRTCMANVEESIKHFRSWIAADENGWRRFIVHPRCKHFVFEIQRYRRDGIGRIIKAFDHGPDEARYMAWILRNGI